MVAPGTFSYLLGNHEKRESDLFVKAISEGDIVFDIGAYVGYYTLLASKSVGPRGRVIAFEPLPKNIQLLRKNLELNRVQNVQIEEAAVAEEEGSALLSYGRTQSSGSLASTGDIEVRKVSLDAMIENKVVPVPDLIKIDINGGELEALRGAQRLLASHDIQLFLSTHGSEVKKRCLLLLKNLEYGFRPIDSQNLEGAHEIYASKGSRSLRRD